MNKVKRLLLYWKLHLQKVHKIILSKENIPQNKIMIGSLSLIILNNLHCEYSVNLVM